MIHTNRRRPNGTKLYQEDTTIRRPRDAKNNAINRLAYKIAGSGLAYRNLPEDSKVATRETARRLHALGANFSIAASNEVTTREGFVYVITNPAFPGFVKIGRAYDPLARLSGYQTGCPLRAYELRHAVYFHDCHWAETEMHARLDSLNETGEWFRMTAGQAAGAINYLRETL